MRKNVLLIFTAMLIAACAPTTSAPVDPYVGIVQAQQEQEFYAAQLTGTAAALEMQKVYWTATAQSWTPTPSLTPVPTATPTITFTPTVNATGTMMVERMNAEIKDIHLETERKSRTNSLLAAAPYIVGFLALGLAVFFGIVGVKRLSMVSTPIHEKTGKPLPTLNVIDGTWMDIDRLPNGVGQAAARFLKSLPAVTADRQDPVTARAQMVDMRSRSPVMQRIAKQLPDSDAASPASLPDSGDIALPLPAWDLIAQWDGTAKPLGVGKAGLITAKAASPHILIAGMTGSGKTLYMMRTLATAGLAKGAQVINICYSASGYGIFSHHKNYHGVQIPEPRAVIECLTHVYDELKQRKALIGDDTREWDHWSGMPPRPYLDILLDELGNMAEDLYAERGPAATRDLWSLLARIANEGRKVGIRFVAALQDPTAKSVDLRFRRNCTLVAFRQGDRSQSDAFLGATGAERLEVGRFMARTDGLVIGGGFAPSDAQILAYLSKCPVRPVEKPRFLEGGTLPRIETDEAPPFIVSTQERLPEAEPVTKAYQKADEEIRILDLHAAGKTPSAIVKAIWGYTAGTPWNTKKKYVEEVIARFRPASTTTSEGNSPTIGNFEPVAR